MKFMTFTKINEKLIGLVQNERQLTHEILNHILLFQKCNGHLKLGYSSMHQYLTRGLGYSDDQAYRRLKAARLMDALPEVSNQYQAAKLDLSQMAEAQKAFETSERETKAPVKREIKAALIANLEKANNFQTKSILTTELKLKPKSEEKMNPQSDQSVRLELSLTKAQFEKLQTIKNLVSHQIPDLNTAKALEMLCDFYISKKQNVSMKTAKKIETRKTTSTKVQAMNVKTVTLGFMNNMKQGDIDQFKDQFKNEFNSELLTKLSNPKLLQVKSSIKRSRYIPVAVKSALLKKSQGCCEYMGPTGIRCNSRYQIQIDHHQAFYFGGENTLENLRNLCAQHNRLAANEQGIGFETTSHI